MGEMPLFSDNKPCVKCGGATLRSRFYHKDEYLFGSAADRNGSSHCKSDRIERHCEQCHYEWDERPLDTMTEEDAAVRISHLLLKWKGMDSPNAH